MINFSTRKVGAIRFIKLGRFCFSICITREYTPLMTRKERCDRTFAQLASALSINDWSQR